MKSVVFCSSQRFAKELKEFIQELRRIAHDRGAHIVILDPDFGEMEGSFAKHAHEKDRLADPQYRAVVSGKVYDHLFRKVRVADVCFIFNKDGYCGINTTGELFAAAMSGKLCLALDKRTLMGNYPHDLYEEPSGQKFIHEVVSTPEELYKRLL